MKIHVDEKDQVVRIEWGGKHGHYTRVSPTKGDHEEGPAKSLGANTQGTDSKVVYETPGYRVNHIDVLSPTGGFVATASSAAQAQKIADALNATKED